MSSGENGYKIAWFFACQTKQKVNLLQKFVIPPRLNLINAAKVDRQAGRQAVRAVDMGSIYALRERLLVQRTASRKLSLHIGLTFAQVTPRNAEALRHAAVIITII